VTPLGLLSDPPARSADCELRLLATNDLLGRVVPLPASWGEGGSAHGVAQLLERERRLGSAVWLDSGDLSVGGLDALFGRRALDDLAQLPVAAAAVGNHEFDDGPAALQETARRLPFPLLCTDREAGLPGSALIETAAGPLGVLGVTHPEAHEFAPAPPAAPDAAARIAAAARALRRAGARWVVALLHDGVAWWATGDTAFPVATRPDRLAATTRGWAGSVDAILGGHTFGAWHGALHGTPAGQAHPCAASVLVVDLPAPPARAAIHPPVRVPATRPRRVTAATATFEAAGREVVGRLAEPSSSVPGRGRFLPEQVAEALRIASAADAGFVPACQLFTQAPLDGSAAALRAGPVTELDVQLLFPFLPDELAIVELGAGELERLQAMHDAATDPTSRSDRRWWNWARTPAGVASATSDPRTLVVRPYLVPLLSNWLGRRLATQPCAVGAREAMRAALREAVIA
jgi:2',3'-cyclic-nucleotide 2'-phosphodiesterase (5'-nucleotidase family)